MGFGMQLALATAQLSSDVEEAKQEQADADGDSGRKQSGQLALRSVRALGVFQVACDMAGQCCACMGAATTNTRYFLYEGRLWLLWSLGVALSGIILWNQAQALPARRRRRCVSPVSLGLMVGGLAMAPFMLFSYCPMCHERWLLDKAAGHQFLPVLQGARDAFVRRVPTRAWANWKDEVLWVTGYFTLGVWTSLGLTYAPRLD